MAPETRTFHAGDILSVLTPYTLSPRGLDGIGDLLCFMAGEPLDPYQWERVAGECEASLAAQHPDLAALTVPAEVLADRDAGMAWLAGLPDAETRPVVPLDPEDHTRIDPLAESAAKYGLPMRSVLRGGERDA